MGVDKDLSPFSTVRINLKLPQLFPNGWAPSGARCYFRLQSFCTFIGFKRSGSLVVKVL